MEARPPPRASGMSMISLAASVFERPSVRSLSFTFDSGNDTPSSWAEFSAVVQNDLLPAQSR